MPKEKTYIKKTSEDILKVVALFCKYHDLMEAEKERIQSSLDRGAFVRPQDLWLDAVPELHEVLDLVGPKKRSDSNAYGPESGDYNLRTKIAQVENLRHETLYTAQNIAMMPGAWGALELTIEELFNLRKGRLEQGTLAVIGPTLYQMFRHPIDKLGINTVAYDFVKPDSEHIPTTMSDLEEIFAEKPKAVVITNPNNPDGKYLSTNLLKEIVQRAEKNKIYVVLDEIQNLFGQNGKGELRYGPWIQSPYVIRLDSSSKHYALAEYRVGWVIAEPHLLGKRTNGKGIVGRMSDFMGNAPRAANTALNYIFDKELEKLQTGEDFLAKAWEELKQKKEYVLDRLNKMSYIKSIIEPDACVNLTVRVNYRGTDLQFAEELMKEGTLIMPASGYGYRPEDTVLRITFAERPEKLKHSLDTLERVLSK